MAMKQDSNIHSQIFQPTLSSAVPPPKTVMKENSHSPKAPAAAPAWRSLRGAIYLRCQPFENCDVVGDSYLRPVEPTNANPTVSKNSIIDDDGSDRNPLRCQGGIWKTNHGHEDHQACCECHSRP